MSDSPARWRIVLIGEKRVTYLSTVQATDAESAIVRAIEQLKINKAHRSRLIAQPIDE